MDRVFRAKYGTPRLTKDAKCLGLARDHLIDSLRAHHEQYVTANGPLQLYTTTQEIWYDHPPPHIDTSCGYEHKVLGFRKKADVLADPDFEVTQDAIMALILQGEHIPTEAQCTYLTFIKNELLDWKKVRDKFYRPIMTAGMAILTWERAFWLSFEHMLQSYPNVLVGENIMQGFNDRVRSHFAGQSGDFVEGDGKYYDGLSINEQLLSAEDEVILAFMPEAEPFITVLEYVRKNARVIGFSTIFKPTSITFTGCARTLGGNSLRNLLMQGGAIIWAFQEYGTPIPPQIFVVVGVLVQGDDFLIRLPQGFPEVYYRAGLAALGFVHHKMFASSDITDHSLVGWTFTRDLMCRRDVKALLSLFWHGGRSSSFTFSVALNLQELYCLDDDLWSFLNVILDVLTLRGAGWVPIPGDMDGHWGHASRERNPRSFYQARMITGHVKTCQL